MRLTQGALAGRIGAAGKAVVYQWESRKRTPSPVLWQRVLDLDHRRQSTKDAQGFTTAALGYARRERITTSLVTFW